MSAIYDALAKAVLASDGANGNNVARARIN